MNALWKGCALKIKYEKEQIRVNQVALESTAISVLLAIAASMAMSAMDRVSHSSLAFSMYDTILLGFISLRLFIRLVLSVCFLVSKSPILATIYDNF